MMSDFENLQRTCERITEVFNQLKDTLNRFIEAFMRCLVRLRRKAETKRRTSPRMYGMSLVNNSSSKPSVKSYDYIPCVHRKLPYQRRRF